MDTNKWKSVLLPKDVYEEIVVIADVEGRTISGQLRVVFEAWKNDNLSDRDRRYLKDRLVEHREKNKPEPEEEDTVFSLKDYNEHH
tara:strand:- start:586 stop:843 length:258 start_codon:yes stop_codon:yes gene_type:complete